MVGNVNWDDRIISFHTYTLKVAVIMDRHRFKSERKNYLLLSSCEKIRLASNQ